MKAKASGRIFLLSCAVVLALTALAKLSSAFGDAKVLDFPDPLWGISNRRFLEMTAAMELVVAGLMITPIRLEVKFLIIAWLGANFILYRIAVEVVRPGKLCPCLGSITEHLRVSDITVAYLLSTIAFYMFAGGLVCYFRSRVSSGRSAAAVSDPIA